MSSKILLFSDKGDNKSVTENDLSENSSNICSVITCENALEIISKEILGLVIIDLNVPEEDGFEIARALKASPQNKFCPIFILIDFKSQNAILRGIRIGGIEFVSLPLDKEILKNKVSNSLLLRLKIIELEGNVSKLSNEIKTLKASGGNNESKRAISTTKSSLKPPRNPPPSNLPKDKADIGVLIVEDFPAMQDLLKLNLEMMGYKKIIIAENGDEGYQALKNKGPINLILLDYNMPKMSGIEFLAQTNKEPLFKVIPKIMVSGNCDVNSIKSAMKMGAVTYVVKPFTYESLEAKIKKALYPDN